MAIKLKCTGGKGYIDLSKVGFTIQTADDGSTWAQVCIDNNPFFWKANNGNVRLQFDYVTNEVKNEYGQHTSYQSQLSKMDRQAGRKREYIGNASKRYQVWVDEHGKEEIKSLYDNPKEQPDTTAHIGNNAPPPTRWQNPNDTFSGKR